MGDPNRVNTREREREREMHYHKEPTSGDWLHPRIHQVLQLTTTL